VAVTSHSGVLSVLDRADGHLVAQVSPRRLGGFPVAVVASPWRGRSGAVLLALRLRDWGVQLRSLP
jgi:hypothetical protein